MKKTKKAKPIKAAVYKEDIEVEDDYFEDENIEEVVEEQERGFSLVTEEEEPEEKYEDARKTFRRENSIKFMQVFNLLFILVLIATLIIGIDVICVARFNVGPFFAINTETYQDGGTKIYYGLGYKVIKYKELRGRQDTQIGFWSMPYSTVPIEIADVDLAIEFQNKPEETSNKYHNQYMKVTSTVKSYDKAKEELVLEYTDPDGKYTLEIKCKMSLYIDIEEYKENDKIAIKGTINKFEIKTNSVPNRVYLNNCFVE